MPIESVLAIFTHTIQTGTVTLAQSATGSAQLGREIAQEASKRGLYPLVLIVGGILLIAILWIGVKYSARED
ncbi:MAG: hypothetical protein AB7V21_12090 [Phycisphaerales bacterium]